MFDINEYYQDYTISSEIDTNNISDIENDITEDLQVLLKNRFNNLYATNCYKNTEHTVDIIYPELGYPGNRSLMINSNKIRHLLSSYPKNSDLENIRKIIVRPRYIEINRTELVSLYLKDERILVIYLSHPYFYNLDQLKTNNYINHLFPDKKDLIMHKFNEKNIEDKSNNFLKIHPVWYFLIMISLNINSETDLINDKTIHKFFLKRHFTDNRIYRILNDMSFFFSRNGY